jgi:preprotein translocase subunit SecB
MADQNQAGAQAEQPQFALQRIYVKDLSFEAPQGHAAFQKQWRPQVQMDLNTATKKLDEKNYEVVLTLTITAKQEDETAFLVEVQQAGIFGCDGFEPQQLHQVLNIMCPNILFPYARETVDTLVIKGSFPPLMVAPVNFEALYQQALAKQAEGKAAN